MFLEVIERLSVLIDAVINCHHISIPSVFVKTR